ncbi:MAG: DDE-type integrase/transposase/recombinase, partial [Blastocatellia bacterium]
SHTKPGSLLKSQIPIRRFDKWNEGKPGFVEIDLVGHDGGNSSGEFCFTLDVTDIFTRWTETRAVKNKAQVWVFKALEYIIKLLPFALLGIDSDNGSEFINAHLLRYCQQQKITFTRARPYRKNDNCFVEERNNSIVRRAVGYQRYDTDDQLKTLNELYSLLRLYTNYFQPVMKLIKKERVGSKVKKVYDKPQTPYHRVLASADVSDLQKRKIRNEYTGLNPAQLKREISRLQEKLAASGRRKEKRRA